MYEFEIRNRVTGEIDIIYGYTFSDACRRSKLNETEWKEIMRDYID